MTWFQRLLLGFRKQWKSYTIGIALLAALAANIALWKKYSKFSTTRNTPEKVKQAKDTLLLSRKHGILLAQTMDSIEQITNSIKTASESEKIALSFIAKEDSLNAKKELNKGIKTLKQALFNLENLKLTELQVELAVLKERAKKEPELVENIAGIEENQKRLIKMIAWKKEMLKDLGLDLNRLEERLIALK